MRLFEFFERNTTILICVDSPEVIAKILLINILLECLILFPDFAGIDIAILIQIISDKLV